MRKFRFVALVTIALLASAAAVYAGNGNAVPGWHANSDKYTAAEVENPNTGEKSSELVR